MKNTISWPDKSLPAGIYCGQSVLYGLEMAAADGLLAMPHTGLGVGGLLVGKRGNQRIDILRNVEIPCSHALGPAFRLTPEEVASAAGPTWREDGDDDYELVGCYWSRPNGRLTPTESDHALFQSLCSEPWQVALVIRPSLGGETMAAFGYRGSGNKLVLGAPHELVGLEKAAVVELETPETAADPREEVAPEIVREIAREDKTPTPVEEPEFREAAGGAPDPVVPVPMPQSGILFGGSDVADKTKKTRRWAMRLLVVAILLAILAATAFLTRAYWLPRHGKLFTGKRNFEVVQLFAGSGVFEARYVERRARAGHVGNEINKAAGGFAGGKHFSGEGADLNLGHIEGILRGAHPDASRKSLGQLRLVRAAGIFHVRSGDGIDPGPVGEFVFEMQLFKANRFRAVVADNDQNGQDVVSPRV